MGEHRPQSPLSPKGAGYQDVGRCPPYQTFYSKPTPDAPIEANALAPIEANALAPIEANAQAPIEVNGPCADRSQRPCADQT